MKQKNPRAAASVKATGGGGYKRSHRNATRDKILSQFKLSNGSAEWRSACNPNSGYESTSRNPPRPTRAADGAHGSGRNLLPQPAGEGGRIETDRAADPETRYSIFGGEFVNLAFGDIQQFSNIGDGEGVRP